MSQLFREIILDYYTNPRNKGSISKPSAFASDWNPLCGDKIKFEILFGEDGHVSQAKYNGDGCAISQVCASMLTEKIQGLTAKQMGKIGEKEVIGMLGVDISPARKKCALLGWLVMRKALKLDASGALAQSLK